MRYESSIGVVAAVSMSPEHGFPTYPQESIAIGMLGIPGDAHSGPERKSFTQPGTLKPNDRPISIVSAEAMVWANSLLDLHMQPGDFNEQIMVSGLGDLGDLKNGDRIKFESGVELEVVDKAYPCVDLENHNGKGLIKALAEKRDGEVYSRRGILCKVVEVGQLKPGELVWVERAE